MKQKTTHSLTYHSRLRLAERSNMGESEFLALADSSAILVYRANSLSQYEMIWSKVDRNGYVLVVDPLTGAIVTIKRVLTQSGSPCLVHDPRKAPNTGHEGEAGVARITSSMLEQSILASGEDLADAQDILGALKKYEAAETKPRSWSHRWVLRFLYSRDGKVATKTSTVGRAVEVMDSPPPDIIEAAAREVAEVAGWDAALTLVARDDMATHGEWSLGETASK
mgnify:CR=1 FL=1